MRHPRRSKSGSHRGPPERANTANLTREMKDNGQKRARAGTRHQPRETYAAPAPPHAENAKIRAPPQGSGGGSVAVEVPPKQKESPASEKVLGAIPQSKGVSPLIP